MQKILTAIEVADNGGRRRIRDRRFLITVPRDGERRTNWDRRSGYDRRLRRLFGYPEERRIAEEKLLDQA